MCEFAESGGANTLTQTSELVIPTSGTANVSRIGVFPCAGHPAGLLQASQHGIQRAALQPGLVGQLEPIQGFTRRNERLEHLQHRHRDSYISHSRHST